MQDRTAAPCDHASVAAAKAGDRQAFEQLLKHHHGSVWTMAYAQLRNRDYADDLTQEVFLIAFLRLDSLICPDRFAPWLHQITRNRITDWIRRNHQSSSLVGLLPDEAIENLQAAYEDPQMDREEEQRIVREAILALSDELREVVLLRFAQGLNNSQIAECLSVHPVTIGRQLNKAFAQLRTSLESVLEESLKTVKPSRRALARTLATTGAVMGMSNSSRAQLANSIGRVSGRSVETTLFKGALITMAMGKTKLAALAIILGILGISVTAVVIKSSRVVATSNSTLAAAPAMMPPGNPIALTFSDGSEVRVLGIQENVQGNGKWWAVDGSEIAPPPHLEKPNITMNDSNPANRTIRMVLNYRSSSNPSIQINVVPSLRTRHSGYSKGRERLIEAFSVVSADSTTADLQIGLANGLWNDAATYDVSTQQYLPSMLFRVGDIAEVNGETSVETHRPIGGTPAYDTSVAVLASGHMLQSAHANGSGDAIIDYFPCAKKEVTKVIVRTRTYETITLKNVSLFPLAAPTTLPVAAAQGS